MKPSFWFTCLCAAILLAAPTTHGAATQEPVPTASAAGTQEPASKTAQPSKKKYSHKNDFLIRGTVFNEKALSFPAVELRFRVQGEKKYRWEAYTNSRGEFAVRVPQGSNYEILVRMKGFVDQTKIIDAKSGGNEESVVFRMQPVAGGKE